MAQKWKSSAKDHDNKLIQIRNFNLGLYRAAAILRWLYHWINSTATSQLRLCLIKTNSSNKKRKTRQALTHTHEKNTHTPQTREQQHKIGTHKMSISHLNIQTFDRNIADYQTEFESAPAARLPSTCCVKLFFYVLRWKFHECAAHCGIFESP